MNCFVTGASGFIGSNLVRELLARGHRVKVLSRPGSPEGPLAGLELERVTGDISDRKLLQREMAGCDWCFHAAASYYLWLRDYTPMYAANVEGTRNVIEAAGLAGCQRIVYTSTVGCIGLTQLVQGNAVPADESEAVPETQLTNHYKRSKWHAEEVAVKLAQKGLPIIIVNPSAPIGPYDVKPTPTGQIVLDFLNHKMPAYVDTGLNWVHVRDVAIGHILAAEKGRIGERYILGHAEGNWTLRETLAVLAEIAGLPAPKIRIPYWSALVMAYVSEGIAVATGITPRVPLAGAPQTPPRQAFADAVEWFRANRYVKR
jgi:dihydroflavonol-4-reductase